LLHGRVARLENSVKELKRRPATRFIS
jgi:hypothetical protein